MTRPASQPGAAKGQEPQDLAPAGHVLTLEDGSLGSIRCEQGLLEYRVCAQSCLLQEGFPDPLPAAGLVLKAPGVPRPLSPVSPSALGQAWPVLTGRTGDWASLPGTRVPRVRRLALEVLGSVCLMHV